MKRKVKFPQGLLKGIISGIVLAGILLTVRLSAKETVLEKVEKDKSQEPPQVALTFDDGPHSVYTPILLDGLKERGIKATFFLMGKNIQGKEDIVKRMAEEGHLIGNHTYSHVQLSRLPMEKAREEVEKTNEEIYEITGEYPVYLRPPYGDWKKDMEKSLEMLPIFWDIDPLDWGRGDTAGIVSSIEGKIEDGSIILLHDCYDSSVKAALQVADDLTKAGYELVTADKLIVD